MIEKVCRIIGRSGQGDVTIHKEGQDRTNIISLEAAGIRMIESQWDQFVAEVNQLLGREEGSDG